MKFRKGDRVLVEGEVSHIYTDDYVEVWVERSAHLNIETKRVRMLEPAKPQVGDTVIIDGFDAETHQVLAIHGDQAWLKRIDNGALWSHGIDRLVVVDRA